MTASRYIPAKTWWDYLPGDPIAPSPLTVYEREPTNTGLLSADGHPIYRNPEPIGFLAGLKADCNSRACNEWNCRIGKVKWK